MVGDFFLNTVFEANTELESSKRGEQLTSFSLDLSRRSHRSSANLRGILLIAIFIRLWVCTFIVDPKTQKWEDNQLSPT